LARRLSSSFGRLRASEVGGQVAVDLVRHLALAVETEEVLFQQLIEFKKLLGFLPSSDFLHELRL
jgi:hypothetical protein